MARDGGHAGMPGSTRNPLRRGQLTIRRAVESDLRALRRLAALDSARAPEGDALLAEVDGEIVAAFDLEDGRTVADPFRPTAEVVGVLELRGAQLRAAEQAGVRLGRRFTRPLRALAR